MGNDKTKWIFDEDDTNSDGAFTESIEPSQVGTAAQGSEETTTVTTGADEKTRVYYPGMESDEADNARLSGETDPVVGWLVIVKGPGLGQSLKIGMGMNMVGRDGDERIGMPFGDTLMSSKDHARIIYDDDSRQFYIAHGSGKSITKVNGQMVANTLPLENRALIEFTKQTHVIFVAFCDESFDWADVAGQSAEK